MAQGCCGGLSKLDIAKMAVEDTSRKLLRQRQAHLRSLQQQQQQQSSPENYRNLGLLPTGGNSGGLAQSLLLLSTSRQSAETASCAVGGRLLVGYATPTVGDDSSNNNNNNSSNNSSSNNNNTGSSGNASSGNTEDASSQQQQQQQQQHQMEAFQRALKSLQVFPGWQAPLTTATSSPTSSTSSAPPFPEAAGGATGLNAALSAGLQLLSRYRLQSRATEHFGLGRLPGTAVLVPHTGSHNHHTSTLTTANGLQPACLVVLTDGACLTQPPHLGGGSLQLQFGKTQPLKDLYQEPFRWDQRVFCLHIGGVSGSSGGPPSALQALCEVTGGSFWNLSKHAHLASVTDQLLQRLLPPLPATLPLPDPLYLRMPPLPPTNPITTVKSTPAGYPPGTLTLSPAEGAFYWHGGPVVALQALEADLDGTPPKMHRAMLLYTGSTATTVYFGQANTTAATEAGTAANHGVVSPPLWCIPEAYFPSKKLDTLPARKAQPLLLYSMYPSNLGSRSFEASSVIKMLHRLDQVTGAVRTLHAKAGGANSLGGKFLHRDVYICEWLGLEGGCPVLVSTSRGAAHSSEYFPVFVPGGGRPTLTEDGDNYLHIGILHVPNIGSSTLAASANASRLATFTMLPPEPHVLLPLLLRATEAEHRLLKKMEAAGTLKGKVNVPLDEAWRSEFRAYLFRVPTYYQPALRFALRGVVPASVLPPSESTESIMKQCFSSVCLQKIRNGEQVGRDSNERIERQEASLRPNKSFNTSSARPLRYGQYDPRGTLDSYLSSLRNMPAPWKVKATQSMQRETAEEKAVAPPPLEPPAAVASEETKSPQSVLDILGDLPKEGLLAYYESRRRWIFGGTGLTTRGIHVEGVNYDGGNSQRCKSFPLKQEESALTLAGVGASTVNQTTVAKMGDFRERLLFSKAPIVGYGSNDSTGVAATTAVDGSPCMSVDDDVMPTTFFDPVTGDFTDNVQTRMRARLMVNFGNPFKEKRGDSLIPENYLSQAPSSKQGSEYRPPPGSPPQDSFDSVEEDEAIFVVRKSPSRTSPRREEPEEPSTPPVPPPPAKRQRVTIDESGSPQPPPPPPPKASAVATLPPPPPPKRTPTKIGGAPPPPPPRPPSVKPVAKGSKPSAARRPSINTGAAPPPPPLSPVSPKTVKTMETTSKPPPPRSGVGKSSRPPPPPQPGQVKRITSGSSVASTGSAGSPTASAAAAAVGTPHAPSGLTGTPNVPTDEDLQRADIRPTVDLPPGWMCVWSKSQKRWYFFNRSNNTSSWSPPRE
jgi:hypothetical protein